MDFNGLGKYRNILLPIIDSLAVVLGYYLISVLITDSFLMNPTSAVTRMELSISIILGIIILQIVFRLSKRYNLILRYENNHDYLMYIFLSALSFIILSVFYNF